MANVAFIGDSYTVGVGDGVQTQNERVALCGVNQPITSPNWIDWPSHFEPGTGWPAVKDYGYIPKLMYFLRQNRKNEKHAIVGLSCMNGANSAQAVAHDCGKIINNSSPPPTHTFIFLGINDKIANITIEQTKQNVLSIMSKIKSGKKYCIGGIFPSRAPEGIPVIMGYPNGGTPWKDVPPLAPPPPPVGYDKTSWPGSACWGHPNQTGYLDMAAAVYWGVENLKQWGSTEQ